MLSRDSLVKVLRNRGYEQKDHECKWQYGNLIIEIFPDFFKMTDDREILSLVMLERLGSTNKTIEKGGIGYRIIVYRFWLYEDAIPNIDMLQNLLGNVEHKYLIKEAL